MTPRERYFAEQERKKRDEAAKAAAAAEKAKKDEAARAEMRRRAEVLRRQNAKKRRDAVRRRVLFTRFLLFVVIFLILLIVSISALELSFSSTKKTESSREVFTYTYVYDPDDDDANVTLSVSDTVSVKDGERCVNFTIIADMASMSLVGSADSVRFIVGNEEVTITAGSAVAVVNSNAYDMDTAAWKDSSGDLWVPVSFIEECMTGVSVTVTYASDETDEDGDEIENTVTIALSGDEISFLLKPSDTIEPIAEDTYPGASDTTSPSEYDETSDTETGEEETTVGEE